MISNRLSLFLLVFFSFFPLKNFAQLDLEHWFPPFYQSAKAGVTDIRLHLSTPSEQPFQVNLYKHNELLQTFTLSLNQPIEYLIPDDSDIRASVPRNSMTPSRMGYHLAGQEPFFASIRINGKYSEVIASKGKYALGKEFLVVNDKSILYDPDEPHGLRKFNMNYQASIMAYHDNTNIRISDFDHRLIFADGNSSDEINITLNKGQSYLLTVLKENNSDPNSPSPILDDNAPNLIGARIKSDKDIVMNNGNFLSQNLGEDGGNINLDQTLPLSKIGKEYFIINGLTEPDGIMEKMILLATEDNTSIYLNNQTAPFLQLNKGEYHIGPGPRFKYFQSSNQPLFTNSKNQTIETESIYVKANKPIYVHQLVGGFWDKPIRMAPDNTPTSSAMLFSFPIDKFQTGDQETNNSIVIPSVDYLGSQRLDRKLIFKTVKGAELYINGELYPQDSFSPVPGNPDWMFLVKYQMSEQVIAKSNRQLIVEHIGGFMYTGIGSSYTGITKLPKIITNGNCLEEGVSLKIDDINFDHFQWQINGIDIPGANQSSYSPTIPGIYTCILTYMDFKRISDPINIFECTIPITILEIGEICENSEIFPKFSSPNQELLVRDVEIIAYPFSSQLTYENNRFKIFSNLPVQTPISDRFVYKIVSTTGIEETIRVNYKLLSQPSSLIHEQIIPISNNNGTYTFNLFDAILLNASEEVLFSEYDYINHNSLIENPEFYTTSISRTIYAEITNSNGCKKVGFFILKTTSDLQKIEYVNFISPNDDGINDTWDIKNKNKWLEANIQIYNRLGLTITKGKVKDKLPWNGKKDGKPLPTDSYWFILKMEDKIIHEGWIFLKHK